MQKIINLWNSATLMTFGSYLVRSLSLFLVLPLILVRLNTADIVLWYLFMTFIGLQSVIDAGFSPTFTRIVAYVLGGARVDELKSPSGASQNEFDSKAMNQVYSTMQIIYLTLGIIWTVLLLTVGPVLLTKPISATHEKLDAWASWAIIICVSGISLYGNLYTSYIQGVNQIALLRRWEILTSLCGILTSFIVLVSGGGLLWLVIGNQVWVLICVIRNGWLARSVENGIVRRFKKLGFNRNVFLSLWPSTWRSGLGVLMSYGVVQFSGIIFAQMGESSTVAMYLFALRLMQTISYFSQAPFYSKIPVLSRLYVEGKKDSLLNLAQTGMRFSYWTFVVGVIASGVLGGPILKLLGSNVQFPDLILWAFLGFAFFLERFGAMHIQLYSTKNHIIWHVANGISGLIYLAVSFFLINTVGVYSFIIGMLAGNIGFYSWFCFRYVRQEFAISFFKFEIRASIFPGIAMLLFVVLTVLT